MLGVFAALLVTVIYFVLLRKSGIRWPNYRNYPRHFLTVLLITAFFTFSAYEIENRFLTRQLLYTTLSLLFIGLIGLAVWATVRNSQKDAIAEGPKGFKRKTRVKLWLTVILLFFFSLAVSPRSIRKVPLRENYSNETDFEADLVNGNGMNGAVVTFLALKVLPETPLGFNIHAGEHLNFYSSKSADVRKGDLVTVRITKTKRDIGGSFLLECDILSIRPSE